MFFTKTYLLALAIASVIALPAELTTSTTLSSPIFYLGHGPVVTPPKCPLMKCKASHHITYHPLTRKCTCEPDIPLPLPFLDPKTCPLIRCAANTHPTYHPEKKRCSCDPVPQDCSAIFCGSGSTPSFDAKIRSCGCKLTNEIPHSCPLLNCITGTHVVFHPETGRCSCDVECPDLMCIATTTPTFNQTTNVCSCEPIQVLAGTGEKQRDTLMYVKGRAIDSVPFHQVPACGVVCENGVLEGTCRCRKGSDGEKLLAERKTKPGMICMIFCEFGTVPGSCRCNTAPELDE